MSVSGSSVPPSATSPASSCVSTTLSLHARQLPRLTRPSTCRRARPGRVVRPRAISLEVRPGGRDSDRGRRRVGACVRALGLGLSLLTVFAFRFAAGLLGLLLACTTAPAADHTALAAGLACFVRVELVRRALLMSCLPALR